MEKTLPIVEEIVEKLSTTDEHRVLITNYLLRLFKEKNVTNNQAGVRLVVNEFETITQALAELIKKSQAEVEGILLKEEDK